jgi:SAM-dependent methyltransferase
MNNYEIETEEYLEHGVRLFQCGLFGQDELSHVAEYCKLTDPKGLIIDMGCGIGEMGALIKIVRPNTYTIGVTNCEYQLKHMQEAGRDAVLSDYMDTPFKDAVADFVMFNESFGYGDANNSVKEASRLLKPGGTLAIKDYRHGANLTEVEYEPTWDYRFYPPHMLIKIAAENGLALDFYTHPECDYDKCYEFLSKSKLKEWHDADYRQAKTILCRFIKL